MYLPKDASRARLREAENARHNRLEIVEALSQGKVTRRELLKWGLFAASGLVLAKRGLSVFAPSAFASIPTGAPRSPLFGVQPFTQSMPRFELLERKERDAQGNFSLTPIDCYGLDGHFYQGIVHQPTKASNYEYQYPCAPELGGGFGPIEGRPPGDVWAHQMWDSFLPQVAVEAWQKQVAPNTRFHPNLPAQNPNSIWTFNGTLPPKLLLARYGEPILFRHHNDLPRNPADNGGFGRHTITTHEHNGHHGAENDGFTGAYFFPGQFYDYHWPIVHAGISQPQFHSATDPRCGSPDGSGGITKLPDDWHETMSTHWFHDHMFSFTAQNVYKGNAAMFNIYSSLDRGNESINDGVNLRLPSGSSKDWGNLDYDINLMIADKAWDQNGQMIFDIFDFDGFLGDVMTANLVYKPYFEVEARKYRFRILNASVSRFFKLALSDGSPMIQIGNDGNLLPQPVLLTELDEQGIAERYDVVIDFSRYKKGSKVWLVNLCEHEDGGKPAKDLSLREALSGKSSDPCVGKFLEFRITGKPAKPDQSRVPNVLIPNPDLSSIPVTRERVFEFGKGGKQTTNDPITSGSGPWGIKTDGGNMLNADFGRISAAPKYGSREIWTLKNGGGGWDHPIHVHFEEGQILSRSNGPVPAWERGRKDVYRLRPSRSVTITMQFRDWGGTFMEHCHNTIHEDSAMLLRWQVETNGTAQLVPLPTPIPTPQGVTFIDPNDILPNA